MMTPRGAGWDTVRTAEGPGSSFPSPWTELPGAGCGEVHQEKILDCPQAPCLPWLCDLRPGVPTDPKKESAAPWGDTGTQRARLKVQSQAGVCHPLRTLACSLCPQS